MQQMKQVEMFPGTKPKVPLNILKSTIQKAYRRGHGTLFNWAFKELWRMDMESRKWLIWRTPIFPAEECWQNLLDTGRVIRRVEVITTSKNPNAWKAAEEQLHQHLISQISLVKNKDADGIRIVAELAAGLKPAEREPLLAAVASRVPETSLPALYKMIEIEEFIKAKRFVKREEWGPIWEMVDEVKDDSDEYQDLRDLVGAAYFRGKKGGMAGDQSMLIALSYLAIDDYKNKTYGGLKSQPQSTQVLVTDDFDGTQPIPPWYCYDMHTGLGRRALGYFFKVYGLDSHVTKKQQLAWLWFMQESALVNEMDPNSIWWPLASKVALLSYGMTVKEGEDFWADWRPRLQAKIEEWSMEEHKIGC